uniref:Transmembrane protein 201 n=1 Tax=Tetraodon nigroviridis TaxID=99883 RepID=H3DCH6_TETNG
MEAFNHLMLEYPQLLYSGVGATAVLGGGALIYKFVTRKKPIHANVNCWFCNQNTVVPYGNRNCWDCPNCDQYNGFQENGDYNKPIPAQYMEHLNHGVSGGLPTSETPKTQQWVNCQMLLCRKCNNNQSLKIKKLASFIPRNEENYDEEIEAYKHHLEQTYKLCRPCQTAVEYYIKYQNRQLRTVLLNHQHRRSRESDKAFLKSTGFVASPVSVVLLRILALLICVFTIAATFYKLPNTLNSQVGQQTLSGGVIPDKPANDSRASDQEAPAPTAFQDLWELLPDQLTDSVQVVWQYGRNNQIAVVSVGLLTCLTAIFIAGPIRLRRIDVMASVLWFIILCLYLTENYCTVAWSWMDTAKRCTISLCCLVSFAAAVATRKPLGPRRARYRRSESGQCFKLFPLEVRILIAGQTLCLSPDLVDSFVPSPPPNLSKLISLHQSPLERKASPSSLPGRLSRALSLGTIPSLSRTDSGFLFSGSRPASLYKESPPSDYFSLKSGSRPSSPGPSPTPSVAGSVTSSSGSARRRPLISPARLNISGQKLHLFSTEQEPTVMSPPMSPTFVPAEQSSIYSSCFSNNISPFQSIHTSLADISSLVRDGTVIEEEEERRGSSSDSSCCLVGTTTQGFDSTTPQKGFLKRFIWPGLLLTSLTANLLFACVYVYHRLE